MTWYKMINMQEGHCESVNLQQGHSFFMNGKCVNAEVVNCFKNMWACN